MQKSALDEAAAEPGRCLRAPRADEARELALLSQFMRHDSVVSLASAIAKRLGGGMRGGDLIAAAGLAQAGQTADAARRQRNGAILNSCAGLQD